MPGSFHRSPFVSLLQELNTKLLPLLTIIYYFPQLSHCLQLNSPITTRISMQEIHHDRLLIFTACLYTPPIGRAGDCAVLAEADAHVPHDLSPVQDAAVPEPRAVREHRLLGSAGSLACLSLAHIGGAYPFLKILFIYSFIYLSEDGFFFF